MKIWTSSWFTPLPPEIGRIGISRSTPRGQSGFRRLYQLQPDATTWSHCGDDRAFSLAYQGQLRALDPEAIVAKMAAMFDGRDVALLCYEAPIGGGWCHRSLVAAWLFDSLGLRVDELGHKGSQHPKLPPRHPRGSDNPISSIRTTRRDPDPMH